LAGQKASSLSLRFVHDKGRYHAQMDERQGGALLDREAATFYHQFEGSNRRGPISEATGLRHIPLSSISMRIG
jgi:hypothetical protein